MKDLERQETGLSLDDLEDLFKSLLSTKGHDYYSIPKSLKRVANMSECVRMSLATKGKGLVTKIGQQIGVDTEFLNK